MRTLPIAIIAALALSATPAEARDEGIPVTIQVVDTEGDPIRAAWVRVPDTEGRRRVDPETGEWTAAHLYTYDGAEYLFQKGMVLEFTVSAPGYQSRVAKYKVRRRRNELTITLPPLEVEEAEGDMRISWFRRDMPVPTQGSFGDDGQPMREAPLPGDPTEDAPDEPADDAPEDPPDDGTD